MFTQKSVCTELNRGSVNDHTSSINNLSIIFKQAVLGLQLNKQNNGVNMWQRQQVTLTRISVSAFANVQNIGIVEYLHRGPYPFLLPE